ncbi:DUF4347 domain-containing protein [Neorhodopirellula lusitana]|uniref:DUF4347 domain-containing protein n=1 Tax=Neorhodopirellula lusitana TaxID=445327 RepID=UPI00384C29C8
MKILPKLRRGNQRDQHRHVAWNVTSLEPRIMLAGDAGAAIAEAVQVSTPDSTMLQESESAGHSHDRIVSETIVFIDAGLADADVLIEGVSDTAELVMLDAETPLLTQISDHLQKRRSVQSVHVVTHGGEGMIAVGRQRVRTETLTANGDMLSRWANALTAEADILIYGCNTGGSPAGAKFIGVLAELTGADVAASDDVTGRLAKKNGHVDADWHLERATGLIESSLAFDATTLDRYQHTLDIAVYASGQTGQEQFELRIDDNVVQTWTASTNIQAYTYQTAQAIAPDRISVHFVNDQYQPEIGYDRNLTVAKIDINGNQTLTTNAPSVYSTGTWRAEDQATPGFGRGDTLHTNGAFYYGQDGSGGPLIAAGQTWRVNDPNGVATVEPGTNNLLVSNDVGTAVWTLADLQAGEAFHLEIDSFVRLDPPYASQAGYVGIDYFDANHNRIDTQGRLVPNEVPTRKSVVFEGVAPQNMEYATIWGWIDSGQSGAGASLVISDVRLESFASDDTTPPTATLTTNTVEIREDSGVPSFTVIYRDDQPSPVPNRSPIQFNGSVGITVTGPDGFEGTPNALGGGSTGDPNEVFTTYGFAFPQRDLAEGIYTVSLNEGHVTDLAGNMASAGVLGTFEVVYIEGPVRPDDVTPPTVSLTTLTASASASLPSFALEFNDTESNLKFTQSGARVRLTGPNGYDTLTSGFAGGDNGNGGLFELFLIPQISATRELGLYTVSIEENYVIDQGNNVNAAAILGTFTLVA